VGGRKNKTKKKASSLNLVEFKQVLKQEFKQEFKQRSNRPTDCTRSENLLPFICVFDKNMISIDMNSLYSTCTLEMNCFDVVVLAAKTELRVRPPYTSYPPNHTIKAGLGTAANGCVADVVSSTTSTTHATTASVASLCAERDGASAGLAAPSIWKNSVLPYRE
jgi:hypothetical protein